MKLKIKVIVEFDTDFDDDVSNEDTAIFTLQQDLDDIGYGNVKITKIGFNVSDDLIKSIQKEMLDYYLFDLTYEQVKKYVEKNMLNTFDTYEREDYASYLAKKICDMDFPMNGDSEESKKHFYQILKEKAPEKGYVWLG